MCHHVQIIVKELDEKEESIRETIVQEISILFPFPAIISLKLEPILFPNLPSLYPTDLPLWNTIFQEE